MAELAAALQSRQALEDTYQNVVLLMDNQIRELIKNPRTVHIENSNGPISASTGMSEFGWKKQ